MTRTPTLRAPRSPRRVGRLGPWARWGTVVAAAASAGIAAEGVWVVRRRLPALVGSDASGLIPGRGEGDPWRVVALGDSSLTGPGLEDPDHIWLRRAIADLDLDRPVDVASLAVGGSRVSDVARRVDDVRDLAPDLVVVAVGCNDVVHATPTRQLATQVADVVGRLVEEVPVVAVTNIGDMGNVARVPPPLEVLLRVRSRTACRTIERAVAAHPRAVLLDVTAADTGLRDRGSFAPDLFHPSAHGHSLWADAARPGLGEAFARLERRADRAAGRDDRRPGPSAGPAVADRAPRAAGRWAPG